MFLDSGSAYLLTPLLSVSVKVALLSDAWFGNPADNWSDVSAYAASDSILLTGKAIVNGALDADDVIFTGVSTGDTVSTIMFYVDTGTPSTSTILGPFYNVGGFPFTTAGANITIAWDSGTSRITRIA